MTNELDDHGADGGEHVSRRELHLTLKAMEWRLRLVIALSVIGEVALSRVSTTAMLALGGSVVGGIAIASKFLHP